MTDTAISALPAAEAITGAEKVPVVQSGTTVRTTVDLLKTFIMAAIVDAAPGTLDTLNELAAALGDDANFASTITTALAGKSGLVTGKHCVPVMAGWIQPSVAGGCAALASVASAANQPDIVSLDFDATTQEYAQFSMPLPKSWNAGTFTFVPIWSHPATTTSFGVVFDLQLVVVRNDDGVAVAFGTAQTSTDTGGTTNDVYYGPESAAITPAGTAADDCTLFGRISRVTGNGSDTMAVDARLHGILLFMTTDAETDA